MKIALITDTHWGIRNDSNAQHDHIKHFLDNVFFPRLLDDGISHVVHLGDIVDRRKYINFNTANRLRMDFLDPLKAMGISMTIIAGNHDTYYKNTNKLNALDELLVGKYDNIDVHTQPTEIGFDGHNVLLLPWICDDNRQRSEQLIKTSTAQIVFGHLELAGFELFRGHVNDHGDDPSVFDRFRLVCSGHYHTRSNSDNIFYLGSPVQFTWSDYNDKKGFYILDLESYDLNFIANPIDTFYKHFYDDYDVQLEDVINFDASKYQNCYVKLVVKNKTNPYWFDNVVDKIEKAGVVDLQVVEDHQHLDMSNDSDVVSEVDDTLTVIHKFIDTMAVQTDKKRVETIIRDLYNEALRIS